MEDITQNQILFFVVIMALTAIPVGFVAGLFGIGGGLITVPFLFYIFSFFEINQSYIMHLAVGTSFAIIIPTAFVSVYTHYKFKAVDFDLVKSYGLFVVLGVIIGTLFASKLNTQSLLLFFSIIILFLGLYLILLKEKQVKLQIKVSLLNKIFFGFISGFISAPMGIGGAVMNVPILKFFGYSINKAIGSFIWCVWFLYLRKFIKCEHTFKLRIYKYTCFFNILSNNCFYGKNWS